MPPSVELAPAPIAISSTSTICANGYHGHPAPHEAVVQTEVHARDEQAEDDEVR